MQAIRFDPNKRELNLIQTAALRPLNDGEILIKVTFSGICGTDLHIVEGTCPVKDSGLILGHEFSGIAQEVGSIIRHIKPGDKVVVDPNRPCHTCLQCTTGTYHLCNGGEIKTDMVTFKDGGWAEYCITLGFQTFKVPDEITLEQAALAEPLSCLAHGWDRVSPISVGQNILIQDAGIIGNLWAVALHVQGHKQVTMSEPLEARRKLFERLETLYRCAAPIELGDISADIIIDCSGVAPAIEKAFKFLAPGGKLCILGVASPAAKVCFSPYELFDKEATIIGVKNNPHTFSKALGLIHSLGDRYLNYERLGVKIYLLLEYKEAIEELRAGLIAKAVFKIGK